MNLICRLAYSVMTAFRRTERHSENICSNFSTQGLCTSYAGHALTISRTLDDGHLSGFEDARVGYMWFPDHALKILSCVIYKRKKFPVPCNCYTSFWKVRKEDVWCFFYFSHDDKFKDFFKIICIKIVCLFFQMDKRMLYALLLEENHLKNNNLLCLFSFWTDPLLDRRYNEP